MYFESTSYGPVRFHPWFLYLESDDLVVKSLSWGLAIVCMPLILIISPILLYREQKRREKEGK